MSKHSNKNLSATQLLNQNLINNDDLHVIKNELLQEFSNENPDHLGIIELIINSTNEPNSFLMKAISATKEAKNGSEITSSDIANVIKPLTLVNPLPRRTELFVEPRKFNTKKAGEYMALVKQTAVTTLGYLAPQAIVAAGKSLGLVSGDENSAEATESMMMPFAQVASTMAAYVVGGYWSKSMFKISPIEKMIHRGHGKVTRLLSKAMHYPTRGEGQLEGKKIHVDYTSLEQAFVTSANTQFQAFPLNKEEVAVLYPNQIKETKEQNFSEMFNEEASKISFRDAINPTFSGKVKAEVRFM
ncbi:MAG: hypothetical protein J0G32_01385 [Alphaproteobacteria bacterium]|nr:hypothetical protein [Alphaproteobacteria bacterium]OJV13180.1 MAG: hypothetical protein BGO27_00045 [Alphaproteobacteria bacterium 33-17]